MTSSSLSSLFLSILALFTVINAHMIMKTPTPFGKSDLNNSPLEPSGADFPCKQRAKVYEAEGASNTMPIGTKQTLSFTGSAVHGGGSCQISLTSDKAPTASSKWEVVHSIQGGCPAKAAAGNIGNDPNGSGASTYEFVIPSSIKPGDYVLAWTWFNRVGNPEMYMNCAPVTVTGGSAKRDLPDIEQYDQPSNTSDISQSIQVHPRDFSSGFVKRDNLPDMFLANIGAAAKGCATTQTGESLRFPDPGSSVDDFSGTFGLKCPSCNPNCGSSSKAAGAPPDASGAAASAAPSAPAAASPSPAPAPATAPAPAPVASSAPSKLSAVPTNIGNVFGPVFGDSAAATPTIVAIPPTSIIATPVSTSLGVSPSAPAVAAPAPAAAPVSAPAPAPVSGPAIPGSQPCSTPGVEVCSPDGKMIGMCDVTKTVIMQPVAAGTVCRNGQVGYARKLRFARRHVRQHLRVSL